MIERLCEELNCTLSHRSNSHPGISMSRDEDDRNITSHLFEPGLQLQTRHVRHLDINNQARNLSTQIGCEEFFRGRKAKCDHSSRLHQIAQTILHGLIVINDRYLVGRGQLGFGRSIPHLTMLTQTVKQVKLARTPAQFRKT
jgi:hypothetical protein